MVILSFLSYFPIDNDKNHLICEILLLRILFITQYFFPETGATSNRLYSLTKYFQDNNHEVEVIAERPNHPAGVFFEGYEKKTFIDKEFKDIKVTYTWVKTKPEKKFIDRILFYVSFMIMAAVAALRKRKRFDIVIASSPPLFVGVSGWLSSIICKAKFVFDIRDLWPDVAVAMGELNNKLAVKITYWLEKFLYKKADLITATTDSFKKMIISKGVSADKIEVIKNGTDPSLFKSSQSVKALRAELNLPSKFIVSYVGNHGLAQGLFHITNAAEQLMKAGEEDIHFLMVGDGSVKNQLKQKADEKRLNNITFIDRVPTKKASKYMNASDTLLVPLADNPIYKQFIPSKLFDSMAAAKPVLLSVPGESKKIVDKAQAGVYYNAEDSKKLIEAIYKLRNDENRARNMSSNGRYWAINEYSRNAQAKKMLIAVNKILM